ncbi:uncharacterized protein A4U43_C08F28090 [Asparagus officinalis]|nr:uncharacterized protein A4U43_C08F28090 [Asparagus officinalis]
MQENNNQEVMWPKLVANKLFRIPSGNQCFVADFPITDNLVDTASSNIVSHNHKHIHKYNTWNVGGVQPSDDLDLDDWLDTRNNSYDIYVLGFQEVVPLKAKNILGAEKSKVSSKWNSLIRTTLNKTLSDPSHEEPKLGEKQKVYPYENDKSSSLRKAKDYRCIVSRHMVGIFLTVWIGSNLAQYILHTSVSCIGCGILGCLGNKGSVSVRFCLHGTSFCIVCCHLASGGKEGDEVRRNSDAMEIFSRTTFPRGSESLDLPQKILDHDRIIMLGDLNYRISLPEDATRSLVAQKEWNKLLEKDQLLAEVSEGRTFKGWQEGSITFSPTYKYYPNSSEYYGCLQGKKGEKKRAPAWCDRIIWYGKGLKQNQYDRSETNLSDHRPVRAIFTVEVLDERAPSPSKSLILSNRLECIESCIDLLSADEGLSSANS